MTHSDPIENEKPDEEVKELMESHDLDQDTAEHFAQTINQLKGQMTMFFIAHGLPKALHVDVVVALGAKADALHPQETPGGSAAPHLVRATI